MQLEISNSNYYETRSGNSIVARCNDAVGVFFFSFRFSYFPARLVPGGASSTYDSEIARSEADYEEYIENRTSLDRRETKELRRNVESR